MAVPSDWPRQIAAAGAIYAPLTAFNDEPFNQIMRLRNVDYTGAAFSGALRAAFEFDSAPISSLTFGTPVLDGSDTLVPVSVAESSIELIRDGVDPGAIETLFYNIKVTPSGGDKTTLFAGEFHLHGA